MVAYCGSALAARGAEQGSERSPALRPRAASVACRPSSARAFARSSTIQTFQGKHQRQCDVLVRLLFDDGLGKPGTDIGLSLASRRLELIETEARDRAAQERLGFTHLAAVDSHPADEGLLHDVLGVSHRAQHAVGDSHEGWTQRIEALRCIPVAGACHQAARTAAFAAAGSSHTPKPTARRFHPLMMLIISVSFTRSSSVNCAFSAS